MLMTLQKATDGLFVIISMLYVNKNTLYVYICLSYVNICVPYWWSGL